MEVVVQLGERPLGTLSHDTHTNRFAFAYAEEWLADPNRFPLAPNLPLTSPEIANADAHSAAVRQFFENLLPEGEALDAAALASRVSKANLMGLLIALGREMAGALTVRSLDVEPIADGKVRRALTQAELSARIRSRPHESFAVWDGRVRLSIAGHQDKLAIHVDGNEWSLADGAGIASTHILKPEPVRRELAGLTSNEYFCMRLAARAGLPTASVELLHVPEPVLLVTRFDRRRVADGVERLHVIDGCQALGLSVAAKYERLYGGGRDVRHIRDGASLPKLFALLSGSARPLVERLALLRWVLFQVLIGNGDAHAKNISFFLDSGGLRVAPAYDLVSVRAIGAPLDASFAMAIGDAFTSDELSPFEWSHFAAACGLPQRQVARELRRLATRVLEVVGVVYEDAMAHGADRGMLDRVRAIVEDECRRQQTLAPAIEHVDADLFR